MEPIARYYKIPLQLRIVLFRKITHNLPIALMGGIEEEFSRASCYSVLDELFEINYSGHVEMTVHVVEGVLDFYH